MNVGWIGLGKLGAPCAMALHHLAGHDVIGYDIDRARVERMFSEGGDQGEQGFADLIDSGPLKLAHTVAEVVAHADVVFVAVQTPHAPAYGGEAPAPYDRRDFEYGFLTQAVRDVCRAAAQQAKAITLVVVSTALPGTCNKHLRGLLNAHVTLVYSPLFIAMGTTIADFLEPEFVLMGADRPEHLTPVVEVYGQLHDRPVFKTSIESAELIKVAYNTVISAKVVIGNTLMEICEKTGADCDQVIDALSLATERVISPKYLRGGMGDGGACHPRDLIAMSWLAQRLELSYDLLGQMAYAREAQSGWLADLAERWADQTGLDIYILGEAYKPSSALTAGSPARLLAHQLRDRQRQVGLYDPFVEPKRHRPLDKPHVYVIGTKHPQFVDYAFPAGSVVLDPHGYMPDQTGVTVIRIGRKS
ncbi:NAD(P)-binding domain-containing protein [Streptosporangium sp. NPDC050855]|uniref:NAD(P)-binding domain-containing protein n=1 Tax=Streptosporangium sp. NPDC050855 TaxID=3366194 RepID=UPI0037991826